MIDTELECAGCEDAENAPHSSDCEQYWPEMRSGDLCRFGEAPVPAHMITHYRCDEYADGTVTDARNGRVEVAAKWDAPRGFKR